jgi:hypothetical protein
MEQFVCFVREHTILPRRSCGEQIRTADARNSDDLDWILRLRHSADLGLATVDSPSKATNRTFHIVVCRLRSRHGLRLLAISAIAYSVVIRGFPYYDPLLMKIFAWGILISLGGFVLSVGGVWRPNSLRWHAPVSAACMATFWIMMASME